MITYASPFPFFITSVFIQCPKIYEICPECAGLVTPFVSAQIRVTCKFTRYKYLWKKGDAMVHVCEEIMCLAKNSNYFAMVDF